METYWIVLALIMLASFINGFMDELDFRATMKSHPWYDNRFLNPKWSWMNKYKDGDLNKGPRFFGSTTFLVFITDGWHLAKMMMWVCMQWAVLLAIGVDFDFLDWPIWSEYLIAYGVLQFVRSMTFHFSFHIFFTDNKIRIMNKASSSLKSWFRALFSKAPLAVSLFVMGVIFLILVDLSKYGEWAEWVVGGVVTLACLVAVVIATKAVLGKNKND